MPELPEVETVCRGLREGVLKSQIISAVKYRDNIRNIIPIDICKQILDARICEVKRIAKYVILELDNRKCLIFHLGMSGKILIQEKEYINKKHDHFILKLDNNKQIIFNDPRRFGIIDIADSENLLKVKYFKKMGVEPFSDDLSDKYLQEKFKNKNMPIKTAIMDSSIIVGVGNIYASESLYRSSISPLTKSNELSQKKLKELVIAIRQILDEAIIAGGSTLRDYVKSSGEKGYFQHKFAVYGKENKPCYKCSDNIIKIVQSGRSTFYCKNCQN